MFTEKSKFENMYAITVLVMTGIILVHDQKHVSGQYLLVGPNALPKRTPDHADVKKRQLKITNQHQLSLGEKVWKGRFV